MKVFLFCFAAPCLSKAGILLCALLSLQTVAAEALKPQSKQEFREAQALLDLPLAEVSEKLKLMDAKESARMLSQVRYLARAKNPDLDRLYLIIRHLEGRQADALSEERLVKLLLVIFFTLLLFCCFLVYILLDQQKAIRIITEAQKHSHSTSKAKPDLYRGAGK